MFSMNWNSVGRFIIGWIPRLVILFTFGGLIPAVWIAQPGGNFWLSVFATLLIIRYTRFLGHIQGYLIYRRSPINPDPTFRRCDVTVVIRAVDPRGPDFERCILSVLRNQVRKIVVVNFGRERKEDCVRILQDLATESHGTAMTVFGARKLSERWPIARVMRVVDTPITILADDHVSWPSDLFIPSMLAPFEDPKVDMVASKARVRRDTSSSRLSPSSIVNFIAQNLVERQNWELRASNAIDGGFFAIPGRTAAYRTEFLRHLDLLAGFYDQKGLETDDDSFLTRQAVKKRVFIRYQDTEVATTEMTLGTWPEFNGQLLRWARSTLRSSSVMLTDPRFVWKYSWTPLMVYCTGLTNFALLWDAALIGSLICALEEGQFSELDRLTCISAFILWIIATKVTKIMHALFRHPGDWLLTPFQIAFAYIHGLYKLWALLTFWKRGPSDRQLDEIDEAETGQAGIIMDDLSIVEIVV